MSNQFDFDFGQPRKGRRGLGYSDYSWVKHGLAYKVMASQVWAYRISHPNDRILLIDGNAGDGLGVPELNDQLDMFGHQTISRPTAQMMVELARAVELADVVLCEKDQKKRVQLMHLFPDAIVLEDHAEAANYIHATHRQAFWLSDPNGPKEQGVKHMIALDHALRCDFIIIFNQQFVNRWLSTTSTYPALITCRKRYLQMADAEWWLQETGKLCMAKTILFESSKNFKYHVLLLTNYLGSAARRHPFVEFFDREGKKHG